jgi:hypothetical protein
VVFASGSLNILYIVKDGKTDVKRDKMVKGGKGKILILVIMEHTKVKRIL